MVISPTSRGPPITANPAMTFEDSPGGANAKPARNQPARRTPSRRAAYQPVARLPEH